MARITIEDCLKNIPNMYELVHTATRRARQIFKGSDPTIKSKNRIVVTALREIAAGTVKSNKVVDFGPGEKLTQPHLPH